MKLSKDMELGEAKCPLITQAASNPSVEWPFAGLEEGGGMESLPFRLMMQDCTAVKTLLLKMKRVLQEVITQISKISRYHVNGLGRRKGSRKILRGTEQNIFLFYLFPWGLKRW